MGTSGRKGSEGRSAVAAATTAAAAAPNNLHVLQQQQDQQQAGQLPKQGPKVVAQWNGADVQRWLRRHCCDLYHLYSELFLNQDITGRSLVRLNENSLLRLGIVHPEHRQVILKQIS